MMHHLDKPGCSQEIRLVRVANTISPVSSLQKFALVGHMSSSWSTLRLTVVALFYETLLRVLANIFYKENSKWQL